MFFVDFFSMSEPVPSKRHRARDSSLATETSSAAVNDLVEFQIPIGPFWDYFHKFDSVDNNRNWSCTCTCYQTTLSANRAATACLAWHFRYINSEK